MKYQLHAGLFALIWLVTLICPALAQTYPPMGAFVGGVDLSGWAANNAAFTSATTGIGQANGNTDIFIDYRSPISTWAGSANYNLSALKSKAGTSITPIVSVGLTDSTAPGSSFGTYNNAASVSFMNAIAAGTYNSQFNSIFAACKAQGFTNFYLRIGWEQNGGNYYGWYATGDTTLATAQAYVAAWKKVADLAHAYATANTMTIQTVWCPCIVNWTAIDTNANTYPGSTYVDIIGPDAYSVNYANDLNDWATGADDSLLGLTTTQAYTLKASSRINREHYWDYPNATKWNTTSGYGIPTMIAFALAQGKPFGLAELGAGNDNSSKGPLDEGDFPYYLANRLAPAIQLGLNIKFICIWDSNSAQNDNFTDGSKPNELASWRQFISAMAATTTAVVPFGANYSIGSVNGAGGGTGTLPGPITVQGGGTGYVAASTADNFNFVARPLSGDGAFVMQIGSHPTSGQTGIMLRAGMKAGDPYAAVYVNSGASVTSLSRSTAGDASVLNAQVTAGSYPLWLKLERAGITVTASQSVDGKSWSYIGSQVIPLMQNAYIGVAADSGSATTTTSTPSLSNINTPNDVVAVFNDAATVKTGTWGSNAGGYKSLGYLTSAMGSPLATATFNPSLPVAGTYDIYAWYHPGSTYASAAPFRANNVALKVNGTATAFALNETVGVIADWNYVGTATMNAGTNAFQISNAGTNGTCEVDAFKFVRNPSSASAMVGSVAPAPVSMNLSAGYLATGTGDWRTGAASPQGRQTGITPTGRLP